MNSYNGFTPSQRSKAGRWLRKHWEEGTLERPMQCEACEQRGVVDAHAEDYSEPYGPHVGEFPLCYACHMMLHCRFRSPDHWESYMHQVDAGRQPARFETRHWHRFQRLYLHSPPELQRREELPLNHRPGYLAHVLSVGRWLLRGKKGPRPVLKREVASCGRSIR